MKRIKTGLLLLALFVGCSIAQAGTIYYWTDENGVRHFSNQGSPEDAEEIGKKPEIIRPEQQASGNQQNRSQGEEPKPENAGTDEATVDEKRHQAEQEQLSQQIDQERTRLQAEIDRIDGFAIGVSFTQGMKDNLMQPYREQLDLLNADPEKYFQMKESGEFDR